MGGQAWKDQLTCSGLHRWKSNHPAPLLPLEADRECPGPFWGAPSLSLETSVAGIQGGVSKGPTLSAAPPRDLPLSPLPSVLAICAPTPASSLHICVNNGSHSGPSPGASASQALLTLCSPQCPWLTVPCAHCGPAPAPGSLSGFALLASTSGLAPATPRDCWLGAAEPLCCGLQFSRSRA